MNSPVPIFTRYIGIAARLWSSIFLILLLLFILSLYGNKSLDGVSQNTTQMYTHPFAVSNAAREVQYRVISMHRSMKDMVLIESISDANKIADEIKNHELEALMALDIIELRFIGDEFDVGNMRTVLLGWQPIRQQIINSLKQGERDVAIHISLNQSAQYVLLIERNIQELLLQAENEMSVLLESSLTKVENSAEYYRLFAVTISMLILVLGVLLIRNIVPPIKRMLISLNKLAEGDIHFSLSDTQRNDEIGQMARSIAALQRSTKQLSEQAKKISTGDLQSEIQVRSDRDTLGQSVAAMLKNLQYDDYIHQGTKQLDGLMRGNLNIETLSQKIISHLCSYANIPIACFYVVRNDIVYCTATYAASSEKRAHQFQLGHGLVGEAALQNKIISISDIPSDYLKLTTATGEKNINQIMLIPVVNDDNVVALIEVGLLDNLDNQTNEFIQTIVASIGITINAAITREREMSLMEAMTINE